MDDEAVDPAVEAAWAAYEDERFEEAIATAEQALAAGAEGDEAAELHQVRGLAALELGDARAALAALEKACALAPGDPVLLSGRGEAELECWRFEDAARTLERAVAGTPGDPHAHHTLAEALDLLGKRKQAERHFRRAHQLDPEGYPLPVRVSRETFDGWVRACVASLPEPIRRRLGPIGFLVEDYPWPAAVGSPEEPGSPRTLGVFFADALPDRYEERPTGFSPQHIIIFQRSLENAARDLEELREEVRVTVIHEVGHYLGYGEDDLDALGLG